MRKNTKNNSATDGALHKGGAPSGNQNATKTGKDTAKMKEERKQFSSLMKSLSAETPRDPNNC